MNSCVHILCGLQLKGSYASSPCKRFLPTLVILFVIMLQAFLELNVVGGKDLLVFHVWRNRRNQAIRVNVFHAYSTLWGRMFKYMNVLNLRGYYVVTAVLVWCYITTELVRTVAVLAAYLGKRTYDELEAATAQLSSSDSFVEQQSNERVLDETVCQATSTVCQHECQQDEECWHYEGWQHGRGAGSTSAHFEASVQKSLVRPHVGQSHSLEHEIRTAEPWQETC